MRNTAVYLIGSIFFVFCRAFSQSAEPLSLDSYINLAKKQNPQMRIANAAIASQTAAWKSSRSRLLPQVSGQAQAARSMSSSSLANGVDYYGNNYSAGISAQQLIFDFGKSYYSNKANSNLITASVNDSLSALLSVVVNAKTAYFNYLLSLKLLEVSAEALSQAQAHLDQAKILVETGKQAQYTVASAEVDAANASVNVITAKSNVKLAKVQMEVAAGVNLHDSLRLSDSLESTEPDIDRKTALDRAVASRPQLLSLRAKLDAARAQVASAKSALLPDLNTNAGIGYSSRDIDASTWQQDWNIGLNLSVPIFQGGALVAAVQSAQASVDNAKAVLDANTQSIQSEIDQDYYTKIEAAERILATQKLIQSSQLSLTLAQERFAAGSAASLEVTDAELALANAKSSHAQALYDYRTAHAKLVAAMGETESR